MQLNEKYVFHIPLYKYENGQLIPLEIDDLIDNLISRFNEKGYENLYITDAEGFYRTRRYDEKLITIYISTSNQLTPDKIFIKWFKDCNDILKQEALAYEHNNQMIIENINTKK